MTIDPYECPRCFAICTHLHADRRGWHWHCPWCSHIWDIEDAFRAEAERLELVTARE